MSETVLSDGGESALALRQQSYDRYEQDIRNILEHCGCTVDQETRHAISLMMHATESVDRVVDDAETAELREKLREAVLLALAGKCSDDLPTTVQDTVDRFRSCVERRGCLEQVTQTVQRMFALQERMRSTADVHTYIDLSLEEGRGVAELIVAVSRAETNATVQKVIGSFAPIGNLIDHLFDAQRDYEKGEIACKPDSHFYARGLLVSIPKLVKLFILYPEKKRGLQLFLRKIVNVWKTRKHMFRASAHLSSE